LALVNWADPVRRRDSRRAEKSMQIASLRRRVAPIRTRVAPPRSGAVVPAHRGDGCQRALDRNPTVARTRPAIGINRLGIVYSAANGPVRAASAHTKGRRPARERRFLRPQPQRPAAPSSISPTFPQYTYVVFNRGGPACPPRNLQSRHGRTLVARPHPRSQSASGPRSGLLPARA
jgi:hypothetical protein